jgi:hypothetical protein
MMKIQDELEDSKEELAKEGDWFTKMQALHEELIKEAKNLKKGKMKICKKDKDDSRENLKKKDEEIFRLQNHNQTLLNEITLLNEVKN